VASPKRSTTLFFLISTHRFNDVVDELLGLVDLVFGIGHDQTVQVLFLVARVSRVRPALAFLDRAFTTNRNLGTGFGLHLLECVATRANEQTNLIKVGIC